MRCCSRACNLPLHIFEPRYRALVGDALIRDRQIAMIQPQRPQDGASLYSVGCVGRIGEIQAMDDGRYNLVLEGVTRFRLVRELDVTTAYRQIEAEIYDEDEDEDPDPRPARRVRARGAAVRRGAGLQRRLGFGRAAG